MSNPIEAFVPVTVLADDLVLVDWGPMTMTISVYIGAIDAIAKELRVNVVSGAAPTKARLPTHIISLQGARAYSLLSIVSEELTGLKALEAKAALEFFPPSGTMKGKITTDVYLATAWRDYAMRSVVAWNRKRRTKLSPSQIQDIVEAWILNRTARARRGLARTSEHSRSDTEVIGAW